MQWQPMETAPKGYDGEKWTHILFKAKSKAGSFHGFVYVSGWMDHEHKPVVNYSYKLQFLGWKPLTEIEDKPKTESMVQTPSLTNEND